MYVRGKSLLVSRRFIVGEMKVNDGPNLFVIVKLIL